MKSNVRYIYDPTSRRFESCMSGPPEHWTSATVFFLLYLSLCQYDALDYMSGIDEPLVT